MQLVLDSTKLVKFFIRCKLKLGGRAMSEKKKMSLGMKVMIGLVLGIIIGIASESLSLQLEVLGKAFIHSNGPAQ